MAETVKVEQYAAKGLKYGEEKITNSRGMKLFTVHWQPLSSKPRGLIFLCHGYGVDCSTFLAEVGERLALGGYGVFGIDYEGHGFSDGLHGLVKDISPLLQDCISHFSSVAGREEFQGLPKFMFGESMGGAVALLIHLRQPESFDGAVLLAPMCKIQDSMKPPPVVIAVLRLVAKVAPAWQIVPAKDIYEEAFKDPVKRAAIVANPRVFKGKPRLATAVTLLNTSNEVESRLDQVSLPLLLLHGEADTVTSPSVTEELFKRSKNSDNSLKLYPGMWHGLLEGEPDENVALVYKDIFEWLDSQCSGSTATVTGPHVAQINLSDQPEVEAGKAADQLEETPKASAL